MTYKKYLKIDLSGLIFLVIISELISYFVQMNLYGNINVSFSILIYIIASIRWGKYGIVTMIAQGVMFMFFNPTDLNILEGTLYYVVANLFIVIPILLYKNKNRNKIVDNIWYLIIYIILSFGFLSLGKLLAILIIEQNPVGGLLFVTTNIFNLVLAIIMSIIFKLSKNDLLTDVYQLLIKETTLKTEEEQWQLK